LAVYVRSFAFSAKSDPEALKLKLTRRYPGSLVQTVEVGAAKNGFLLEMIAAQTVRAEATANLLAKRPEMDFLLRVAGTTQISEAIRKVGSRKKRAFLLVIADSRQRGVRLKKLGGRELPKRKLSEAELRRVEDAALLNALRA
jgi:tRNA threonylcarbamoyladenosine modification (KEOPS) complex Cgi121 subunit